MWSIFFIREQIVSLKLTHRLSRNKCLYNNNYSHRIKDPKWVLIEGYEPKLSLLERT